MLKEVHEIIYRNHLGKKVLVRKVVSWLLRAICLVECEGIHEEMQEVSTICPIIRSIGKKAYIHAISWPFAQWE